MKLILDEIITNAVYHAPAYPDGTEKYPEYVEVKLQPDEFVYVECGQRRREIRHFHNRTTRED